MTLQTRTSTQLLEGLKDPADRSSWIEFDNRYRPLALAVSKRLGLQESDAEDAAQETMAAFLKGYSENKYDRSKGRLRDWICGIASHKIRDIQRRQGRREKHISGKTDGESIINLAEDSDVRPLWDDECKNSILRQCLEEVRREVSYKVYESFDLYALKGQPVEQVASHLQISVSSVYKNKSRILQRIRETVKLVEEIW